MDMLFIAILHLFKDENLIPEKERKKQRRETKIERGLEKAKEKKEQK